ncbi:hypothetical protein ACFPRL_23850 [Pseudoclavibacter helvolus]
MGTSGITRMAMTPASATRPQKNAEINSDQMYLGDTLRHCTVVWSSAVMLPPHCDVSSCNYRSEYDRHRWPNWLLRAELPWVLSRSGRQGP